MDEDIQIQVRNAFELPGSPWEVTRYAMINGSWAYQRFMFDDKPTPQQIEECRNLPIPDKACPAKLCDDHHYTTDDYVFCPICYAELGLEKII